MRRAAGRGGRRGGDGGPDRGGCGAAPGARRRHRPARRQRLRRLPRHPGVPAEVRRRRRRRARQGQPRAAGAHLRPGDAALPRGVSLGQRPRRRGVHRRARAGAVRGDRRLEARPGGARRRDVPEPVRDQRLEAAAVADPGRGAESRAPPGWRPRPARAARVSARPTSERRRRAAGQEVLAAFEQQVRTLAIKYGQTGPPRLDDPTFVSSVVFDSARAGQPKPRFSLFWPSADSAQILVRLRPDLSQSERGEAIDQIRAAVADPAFSDPQRRVRGQRGAGGRRRACGEALERDRRAADRRARRHDPDPGAGVRPPGCGCCRSPSRWPRRRSPSGSCRRSGAR